jgi:hypothetical protein
MTQGPGETVMRHATLIRIVVGAIAVSCLAVPVRAQTHDQVRADGQSHGPDLARTNMGEWRVPTFEGHDLSATTGLGAILYAPAESDDEALRAAIAAAAGGAVVDYFDARAETPSTSLLLQYDCVMTWVNFAYADNVLFGDNLAAYVDQGGVVVLGAFCTFTSGSHLAGAIMTPGYCPVVSPSGGNHFELSPYIGDGETCIYDGVGNLECRFRDFLVLQGDGIQDGSYADGEICHAYRPDGRVVYSNGNAGGTASCLGDGAVAIANACGCLGQSACPWDFDGDGDVDFQELLKLLSTWGPCPIGDCPWDFSGDGDVNFQDLLKLLSAWGDCP